MGLQHIGPRIEQDHYVAVCRMTWGHLAPKRNVAYSGVIQFAVGAFGDDPLNPLPIKCELQHGDDEPEASPWLYDALQELLQAWAAASDAGELPTGWPRIEPGGVYEWRGTFRSYKFRGSLRRMTLT